MITVFSRERDGAGAAKPGLKITTYPATYPLWSDFGTGQQKLTHAPYPGSHTDDNGDWSVELSTQEETRPATNEWRITVDNISYQGPLSIVNMGPGPFDLRDLLDRSDAYAWKTVAPLGQKSVFTVEGPLAFHFRGSYVDGTIYVKGDIVFFNGSSWIALDTVPIHTLPDSGAPHWALFVQQGTSGGSFQGNYDPTKTYSVGDIVFFQGGSWVARDPIALAEAPSLSDPNWSKVADPGSTGATGPQGPPGPNIDATTSIIGSLLLDHTPSSGHPVALTQAGYDLPLGTPRLDSGGRVPLSEIGGLTNAQIVSLDAARLTTNTPNASRVLSSNLGTPAWVDQPDVSVYNAHNYTDLAAFLTAIGSERCVLSISTPFSCNDSVTVPANVAIRPTGNGTLTIVDTGINTNIVSGWDTTITAINGVAADFTYTTTVSPAPTVVSITVADATGITHGDDFSVYTVDPVSGQTWLSSATVDSSYSSGTVIPIAAGSQLLATAEAFGAHVTIRIGSHVRKGLKAGRTVIPVPVDVSVVQIGDDILIGGNGTTMFRTSGALGGTGAPVDLWTPDSGERAIVVAVDTNNRTITVSPSLRLPHGPETTITTHRLVQMNGPMLIPPTMHALNASPDGENGYGKIVFGQLATDRVWVEWFGADGSCSVTKVGGVVTGTESSAQINAAIMSLPPDGGIDVGFNGSAYKIAFPIKIHNSYQYNRRNSYRFYGRGAQNDNIINGPTTFAWAGNTTDAMVELWSRNCYFEGFWFQTCAGYECNRLFDVDRGAQGATCTANAWRGCTFGVINPYWNAATQGANAQIVRTGLRVGFSNSNNCDFMHFERCTWFNMVPTAPQLAVTDHTIVDGSGIAYWVPNTSGQAMQHFFLDCDFRANNISAAWPSYQTTLYAICFANGTFTAITCHFYRLRTIFRLDASNAQTTILGGDSEQCLQPWYGISTSRAPVLFSGFRFAAGSVSTDVASRWQAFYSTQGPITLESNNYDPGPGNGINRGFQIYSGGALSVRNTVLPNYGAFDMSKPGNITLDNVATKTQADVQVDIPRAFLQGKGSTWSTSGNHNDGGLYLNAPINLQTPTTYYLTPPNPVAACVQSPKLISPGSGPLGVSGNVDPGYLWYTLTRVDASGHEWATGQATLIVTQNAVPLVAVLPPRALPDDQGYHIYRARSTGATTFPAPTDFVRLNATMLTPAITAPVAARLDTTAGIYVDTVADAQLGVATGGVQITIPDYAYLDASLGGTAPVAPGQAPSPVAAGPGFMTNGSHVMAFSTYDSVINKESMMGPLSPVFYVTQTNKKWNVTVPAFGDGKQRYLYASKANTAWPLYRVGGPYADGVVVSDTTADTSLTTIGIFMHPPGHYHYIATTYADTGGESNTYTAEDDIADMPLPGLAVIQTGFPSPGAAGLYLYRQRIGYDWADTSALHGDTPNPASTGYYRVTALPNTSPLETSIQLFYTDTVPVASLGLQAPAINVNTAVADLLRVMGGTSRFGGDTYISAAIAASTQHGLLSLGGGPFNGITSPATSTAPFIGNANGTGIAMNLLAGVTADLLNFQVSGSQKALLDTTGALTLAGALTSGSTGTFTGAVNASAHAVGTAIATDGSNGASSFTSRTSVPTTTKYGRVSLGSAPFDGVATGFFAGTADITGTAVGTEIAINISGGADILHAQRLGVSRVKIDAYGGISAASLGIEPSVAATVTDVASSGGLMLSGTREYAYTWITSVGSTAISPRVSIVQTASHQYQVLMPPEPAGTLGFMVYRTNSAGGLGSTLYQIPANTTSMLTTRDVGTGQFAYVDTVGDSGLVGHNSPIATSGPGSLKIYGSRNILGGRVNPSTLHGLLSLGGAPFDGSTSGFFTGNANGTGIAMNLVSGSTADLLNLQVGGVPKFIIDRTGAIATGSAPMPSGGTAGQPLLSNGASPSAFGNLGVGAGGTGLTAAPSNGQLLIGNGTGYTLAALAPTAPITTTPGAGSLGIGILAATSSAAGSLSAADKTKLDQFSVTAARTYTLPTITDTLAGLATANTFTNLQTFKPTSSSGQAVVFQGQANQSAQIAYFNDPSGNHAWGFDNYGRPYGGASATNQPQLRLGVGAVPTTMVPDPTVVLIVDTYGTVAPVANHIALNDTGGTMSWSNGDILYAAFSATATIPATAPAPTTALAAGGLLSVVSTYTYMVTWFDGTNETGAGAASPGLTPATNKTINITNIPLAPGIMGASMQRRIYRSTDAGTTWALLTTVTDNTSLTLTAGNNTAGITADAGATTPSGAPGTPSFSGLVGETMYSQVVALVAFSSTSAGCIKFGSLSGGTLSNNPANVRYYVSSTVSNTGAPYPQTNGFPILYYTGIQTSVSANAAAATTVDGFGIVGNGTRANAGNTGGSNTTNTAGNNATIAYTSAAVINDVIGKISVVVGSGTTYTTGTIAMASFVNPYLRTPANVAVFPIGAIAATKGVYYSSAATTNFQSGVGTAPASNTTLTLGYQVAG